MRALRPGSGQAAQAIRPALPGAGLGREARRRARPSPRRHVPRDRPRPRRADAAAGGQGRTARRGRDRSRPRRGPPGRRFRTCTWFRRDFLDVNLTDLLRDERQAGARRRQPSLQRRLADPLQAAPRRRRGPAASRCHADAAEGGGRSARGRARARRTTAHWRSRWRCSPTPSASCRCRQAPSGRLPR